MSAADVIVVGGGVMGASTALFLRRRGLSVILLERGLVGQQASGVNFGGVRRLGRPLNQLPLSHRSHGLWTRLNELIGEDCEFRPYGYLAVTYSDEKAAEWERYSRDARDCGLEVELINGNALREQFPYLGVGLKVGFLSRKDGHANPRLLSPAIGRAAQRAGAHIQEQTEVAAIEKLGEDFRVTTSEGAQLRAPIVVIAAGAWGARIAADFGEPVPLIVQGPQMGVTEPLPYKIPPTVSVLSDDPRESVYFRQVERGNVVFGGGPRGPASTETNRAAVLPENTLGQMPQLCRLAPPLVAAHVIRTWSGVEGYMPDALPVLGPSRRVGGLYYAFGFSGAGFQLGPGIGDVLAELIATGRCETSLEGHGVERFDAAPGGNSP
jgi:sarcosine oxidase subunit beta